MRRGAPTCCMNLSPRLKDRGNLSLAVLIRMTDRHPSPAASATGDLGFTYRLCKNGNVEVRHHGKLASTLRERMRRTLPPRLREATSRMDSN